MPSYDLRGTEVPPFGTSGTGHNTLADALLGVRRPAQLILPMPGRDDRRVSHRVYYLRPGADGDLVTSELIGTRDPAVQARKPIVAGFYYIDKIGDEKIPGDRSGTWYIDVTGTLTVDQIRGLPENHTPLLRRMEELGTTLAVRCRDHILRPFREGVDHLINSDGTPVRS